MADQDKEYRALREKGFGHEKAQSVMKRAQDRATASSRPGVDAEKRDTPEQGKVEHAATTARDQARRT